MNIDSTKINQTIETKNTNQKTSKKDDSSVKFADELKEMKKEEIKTEESSSSKNEEKSQVTQTTSKESEEKELNEAMKGLSSMVEELNQSDENSSASLKNNGLFAENEYVINNDFNIQENKEILPQMTPNMNFSGDGQPFSSFMNGNENQSKNPNSILGATAQDLAEEAAILSSMAENIAIANRNQALKNTKNILNEEGIKKVDTKTGIKIENIVKFDSVIMNQADVEVFANLVENRELNLNNLAPKAAEKSIQVSKTLADILAKAMEKNQPVRIDFDNNISVIIKISRDGKITADFLPSSQVAEAYLKENLPLLRQRFDDNNINYDSLNQRERRDNKENNRKKERNNE